MRITVEDGKKEFKPFILSLEIEDVEDLKALYNRFNITQGALETILGGSYLKCKDSSRRRISDVLENKIKDLPF